MGKAIQEFLNFRCVWVNEVSTIFGEGVKRLISVNYILHPVQSSMAH